MLLFYILKTAISGNFRVTTNRDSRIKEYEMSHQVACRLAPVLTIGLLISGCATLQTHNADAVGRVRAVMLVPRTTSPILIDGRLDEPVWQQATAYPLSTSRDKMAAGFQIQESGSVRLAWDDKALYVAVEFEDSDIVAEGQQDQLHHYELGDVAEVFLRPVGSTWYWELYATPHGHKTEFFFPGRGRLPLPSCFGNQNQRNMRVAATNRGSINDWTDRDHSWSAEFAVPIADLTEYGNKIGPQSQWHALVARYNYSRYLDRREHSSAPTLSELDYHRLEDYAVLKFE